VTRRLRFADPLELATLSVVALCPGFIGEHALQPLLDDARQLPTIVDWVAYERLLGDETTGIDLSISVSRGRASDFVEALEPRTAPALTECLRRWAGGRGGPALRRVPNVWLEFDHDLHGTRPLWDRAFCFLGLDAGPHPRGAKSLIPELATALGDGDAPQPATSLAVEVEQTLPASARLLNIACLLHRGQPEVRLHLKMPRAEVSGALRSLSWSGDSRALDEVLRIFDAVHLDRVAVQLALREGLAPSVGFELYLPQEHAETLWPRVWERMRSLGLSSADELRQIQGWHGRSTLRGSEFPGRAVASCLDLLRRTHVKFTVGPQGFGGTKAYLFGYPRRVPF